MKQEPYFRNVIASTMEAHDSVMKGVSRQSLEMPFSHRQLQQQKKKKIHIAFSRDLAEPELPQYRGPKSP